MSKKFMIRTGCLVTTICSLAVGVLCAFHFSWKQGCSPRVLEESNGGTADLFTSALQDELNTMRELLSDGIAANPTAVITGDFLDEIQLELQPLSLQELTVLREELTRMLANQESLDIDAIMLLLLPGFAHRYLDNAAGEIVTSASLCLEMMFGVGPPVDIVQQVMSYSERRVQQSDINRLTGLALSVLARQATQDSLELLKGYIKRACSEPSGEKGRVGTEVFEALCLTPHVVAETLARDLLAQLSPCDAGSDCRSMLQLWLYVNSAGLIAGRNHKDWPKRTDEESIQFEEELRRQEAERFGEFAPLLVFLREIGEDRALGVRVRDDKRDVPVPEPVRLMVLDMVRSELSSGNPDYRRLEIGLRFALFSEDSLTELKDAALHLLSEFSDTNCEWEYVNTLDTALFVLARHSHREDLAFLRECATWQYWRAFNADWDYDWPIRGLMHSACVVLWKMPEEGGEVLAEIQQDYLIPGNADGELLQEIEFMLSESSHDLK